MNEKEPTIPDIRIRDVDIDTHKIVIEEQARQKELRGVNNFSLSDTIKLVLKEWNDAKCRSLRYKNQAIS